MRALRWRPGRGPCTVRAQTTAGKNTGGKEDLPMTRATFLRALPFLCLLLVGTAYAEDPDATLKSLPAPVMQAIQAEQGDKSVFRIDVKGKDGQKRYKVILKSKDGMQKRLFLDDKGTLLRLKNDVALDALPAPVKKTSDENSAGKFVRSTKVTHDAKTEYEVEYDVNGFSKELLLDDAGKLERVEEVVSLSGVPAKAKAAIEKEVGKNKLVKVVASTETGKATTYEAQFEVTGRKSEITLSSDGKVLERE
jgi:hypothetical protein